MGLKLHYGLLEIKCINSPSCIKIYTLLVPQKALCHVFLWNQMCVVNCHYLYIEVGGFLINHSYAESST